jgi:nucleoside-diphosphate-sugar epimerase
MPHKILVTGAAGFIGSHLVDRLLADGHEVTGIDCFTDYYDIRIKKNNISGASRHDRFTFVGGSLNDVDLHGLLADRDVVFHQAAQAGVRASWGKTFESYIDSNVRATQKLCEAARKVALKKLVFASSSSVYGETTELPMKETHPTRPVSPYGVTKLDSENMCLLYRKSFGLPVVCLRYFTVYGPRQRPDMAIHRFLRGAMEGDPVEVFGNGEQTRDFTFVSDVVDANLAAMDYEGEEAVLNIGGGSRVTINRTLDLVGRYAVGDFDVRYSDTQKGDVPHTYADTSLAQRELTYSPKMDLDRGIEREADWLRHMLGSIQNQTERQ